jgi:hypothetical protein
MSGPPQIFPPLPVNIPGNIAPVTLVSGQPVFEPQDPSPALASKALAGVALVPPSKADPIFVPPIAFEVDPSTFF